MGLGKTENCVRLYAAAMVKGRTHATVDIIDKTDGPYKVLHFLQSKGLVWLDVDQTTAIALMLCTGAWGLGLTWLASQHGGRVDPCASAASCAS